MIIGIDTLGKISGDTGGRTYLFNFSRALQQLGTPHQFIFFVTPGESHLLGLTHPQFKAVEVPWSQTTVGRILVGNLILPELIRRHAIDVMLFPANFASLQCPVPYVVAIRSMLNYNTPDRNSVGRAKSYYRRWLLNHSARNATRIITPSPHTREEIRGFLDVKGHPLTVVPHGIDVTMFGETADPGETEAMLEHHGIRRPYILYVSALWEYKNHDKLILAFEKLVKIHHIPHRLVLVGRGMNSYESYAAKVHTLVQQTGLTDRVTFIDFLPHDKLRYIYRAAALFAFPSRTESFGHPLFEAMAAGIPVVCSNTHGFEQMIPGCALFSNPYAVDEFAAALETGLNDETLRKQLIARSQDVVRGMTWETCARQTVKELELALERS